MARQPHTGVRAHTLMYTCPLTYTHTRDPGRQSISSQGEGPTATVSLWETSSNSSRAFCTDCALQFAKHFHTHRISR